MPIAQIIFSTCGTNPLLLIPDIMGRDLLLHLSLPADSPSYLPELKPENFETETGEPKVWRCSQMVHILIKSLWLPLPRSRQSLRHETEKKKSVF